MILMWLGSLVIMLFGVQIFRDAIAHLGSGLQTRFLNLPETGGSIFRMLFVTKLAAVGQGSFLQTQYGAVGLLNSRDFSKRYGVLFLCLSVAGLWPTLLVALFSWQLQGALFVGLSAFFFLLNFWFGKGKWIFRLLLGLGLYFWGTHLALRDQTILMSVLGESEWRFLLADGRFSAQLLWLAVSFLVTLVIGIESWAVFLSIVLLASGTLSLNGAVAFVVGELLAHVWVLFWRSRKLNQEVRRAAKYYAIASSLGLGLGFFFAGILRNIFAWGYSFGLNDITERNFQFLIMYFGVLVFQGLVALCWGHFFARAKLDEVQAGEYFPIRWFEQGLISKDIFGFIQKKLKDRLMLLLDQEKSLNEAERAQIPATFLQNHKQEVAKLSDWLRGQ